MLRDLFHPSPTIRSAVIIAASVALILPLPVRCPSCSTGSADCSQCQAADARSSRPAHRSCCEHRAGGHLAKSAVPCSSHVQSKACGCKLQGPERTYVASDRQVVAPELVAVLPNAQPFLTPDRSLFLAGATSHSDLPPPVPHRILHCSWII